MTLTGMSRMFVACSITIAANATPARAQQPRIELGSSLTSVTFALNDQSNTTIVGVPSAAGAGLGASPGAYVSVFIGGHFAVEPQVGLLLFSFDGDSMHLLNMAGQADYFVKDVSKSSPYFFGGAGFVHVTGDHSTPATFSGGGGYRFVLNEHVALRLDIKYTRFVDTGNVVNGSGNALAVTVSLGGLLGRR